MNQNVVVVPLFELFGNIGLSPLLVLLLAEDHQDVALRLDAQLLNSER
jgi:hypothetical protein